MNQIILFLKLKKITYYHLYCLLIDAYRVFRVAPSERTVLVLRFFESLIVYACYVRIL